MRESSLHARMLLCAACVLLSSGRIAYGQTNVEANAGLQFNFSSPGARSLALGGAFVGLADDATAAYTNPAGLTQLSKPEISAEGRRTRYTTQFTDSGHDLGTISKNGQDTVQGIVTGTSKDTVNDLSFASFVYPGRRWAVAVYRQELANFATSFTSHGAFFGTDSPNPAAATLSRLLPIKARLSLRIIDLGASGALRITDALSIGLGVSDFQFSLASQTDRFDVVGFDGPPDFSKRLNFQTLTGSDHATGFNAGLLWKPSPKWSAGAYFRLGPKLTFTGSSFAVDASGAVTTDLKEKPGTFHVPDMYGAGIAFRPAEALTITADYDLIRYSQLTQHTVDTVNPMPDAIDQAAVKKLGVDDANEFHLGIEYVLTRLKYPLALRVGGWWDPDHRIRFKGTADPAKDANEGAPDFLTFRPGKDEAHVSGGLGLVIGEHFQLDAAYDYSKFISIASLSGVVRF
jgi:long-chain fatty acid transport protein